MTTQTNNVVIAFDADSKVWTVEGQSFASKQDAISFAHGVALAQGRGATLLKKDGSVQLEVTKVRGPRTSTPAEEVARNEAVAPQPVEVIEEANADQAKRDRRNARRRELRAIRREQAQVGVYEGTGNLDAAL